MKGLSLFSGIGGIDVALSDWVNPIAYCEIDPYCQSVLLQRMQEGNLPKAPIWDDIRTLPTDELPTIDIIYGGFPCTDISINGKRKGLQGKESGLFFEVIRLSKEVNPQFIFLENTKGILSKGGIEVMEALASLGYNARWITTSCKEVGSPQNRERWFCLAYSNSEDGSRLQVGKKSTVSELRKCVEYEKWNDWPEDESALLGVDDVISSRVDRIKALGNSVCVPQVREAFKLLMGLNL